VSWPPAIGEPLPRADDAFGVEGKLAAYCLNRDHELGEAKARGFLQVLGITVGDVEYLAAELLAGVLAAPITSVRDNAPFGVLCEVRIRARGLREHHDRVVEVVTSWELRHDGDPPRLVTAYIGG
jgi:hypothetical protein